ncbi:hypothetical protein BGW38_000192 [Lunasporangiospora selenospora]|uniref:Uncharacterized protein n=1 Tax=Lunasporangiospora selenospora TaxID=979761 RepID=A0A9P6FWH8_9FUNG|nr:hypothetical protein BGW38_000192 [Lunasporangiospora selenospora]
MNIFSSLGKLIWGDSSNPELVQISSGQFYVYKPSSNNSKQQRTRKCIFIDSMATIRRTSQPFQFMLAVSRVFEEGEEDLQDDEQELDDEKLFLIDGAIRFRKGVSAGSTTFLWVGLSPEDVGFEYEFVCDDDTTVYTANNFEITAYHCMYERKHQRSHFGAEDDAISEFKLSEDQPKSGSSTSKSKKQKETEKTVPASTDKQKKAEELFITKPSLRTIPTNHEKVIECRGELNLYDPAAGLFMKQEDNIRCQLVRTDKFSYWILVYSSANKSQLAQPIEPKINPVFSINHLSFIWNYFDDEQGIFSYLIRFPTKEAFTEFQAVLSQCMYETLNHQAWSKVAPSDQKYMIRTYQEDTEMEQGDETGSQQYSDEESEEYSDEEGSVSGEEDQSEEDEDEDEDEDNEFSGGGGSNATNSQLAVGSNGRSFVVRGNKIGVFRHNEQEGLDFDTTIKNVTNSKGREINPSKVVLQDRDSSMVMMDPRDLDKAYKMDLEYGKVVEEWELPGTSGVINLIGDSKYSHLRDTNTMIGHSHNAMFRVDPRLSGTKIVDSQFKQYAKGNDFTCAATSANGSLAIAGSKGEIKLLNVIGKNAKTAIPGLGDPIIGVDVTGNGRYVIATCKTYLLLIDVLNPENKRLGFELSFPATEKPKPIKLQLKPEHVAMMNRQISFTPARFNSGENEEEKAIVTSTGPFVITWNFRRVKNGHYDYMIKEYGDNIVADNFKYGQDRSIIVALPNDVTAVAKRNLTSPAAALSSKDTAYSVKRDIQPGLVEALASPQTPDDDNSMLFECASVALHIGPAELYGTLYTSNVGRFDIDDVRGCTLTSVTRVTMPIENKRAHFDVPKVIRICGKHGLEFAETLVFVDHSGVHMV